MWQQIIDQLDHGKRYIVELIDQSTSAYDQRDDLCSKIQNLREKGLSESGIHMQVSSLCYLNLHIIHYTYYTLI